MHSEIYFILVITVPSSKDWSLEISNIDTADLRRRAIAEQ